MAAKADDIEPVASKARIVLTGFLVVCITGRRFIEIIFLNISSCCLFFISLNNFKDSLCFIRQVLISEDSLL